MGDAGSMCRKLAWNEGWRPDWWDKKFEAAEAGAKKTVAKKAARAKRKKSPRAATGGHANA